MSIKPSEIKVLEKVYYKSPVYSKLVSEGYQLSEKIRNILQAEATKGLTAEEIKILEKLSYLRSFSFYPGLEFRNKYYPEPGPPKFNRCSSTMWSIKVKVPESQNFVLDLIRNSEVLNTIIPINDKIIDLSYKLSDLQNNFDRFINENTSLVWLRKNLPEFYKILKK